MCGNKGPVLRAVCCLCLLRFALSALSAPLHTHVELSEFIVMFQIHGFRRGPVIHLQGRLRGDCLMQRCAQT